MNNLPKRPVKKFIQLAVPDKTQGWLDIESGTMVPYDKMSEDMLRKAIVTMQAKELRAFNRAAFFGTIADNLMSEAEKRGLQNIEIYDTEYTRNNLARKEKEG